MSRAAAQDLPSEGENSFASSEARTGATRLVGQRRGRGGDATGVPDCKAGLCQCGDRVIDRRALSELPVHAVESVLR